MEFSKIFRNITVEPVLFVFMFGVFLNFITVQQLLFQKSCLQIFNQSFCANIISNNTCKNRSLEYEKVSSSTSQWILYQTLSFSIPSIISSLFLGSLSDQFGRKLVILLPFVGNSLNWIATLINVVYMDTSPAFLLFGSVISGFFGAYSTVLLGVLSYMADITNNTDRTWRIGVLESMTFFGGMTGELLSGILISNFGFMAPFIVNLILNFITIIYILCFLKESYIPQKTISCKTLLSYTNFKGCVELFTKQSRMNLFYFMLVFISAFLFPFLVFTGTNDVLTLYIINYPFCFSSTMIGYFFTYLFAVKSLGVLIGMPTMSKFLKFSDPSIVCIAIVSSMSTPIFLAFTKQATLTAIFAGVSIPTARSMMSKMVGREKQGSLFAVLAGTEVFTGIIASLIFNNIYKATVSTWPGLCFIVMSACLVMPLVFVIFSRSRLQLFISTVPEGLVQSEYNGDLFESTENIA